MKPYLQLLMMFCQKEERRNGRVQVNSGIKAVLLGKVEIPPSLDVIDEKTEEGKRLTNLNEIAFTELILFIDVSISNGKIAFGILKRKSLKMVMQR
jgi:hypothetical protein